MAANGVPPRPRLPGVAASALLSWTLGTSAVLLGLALIGIVRLHEARFDRSGLSIAILVLSSVGLAVGLIATIALARSLADPIESLRHALGGIERGELDPQVAVDDGSEVGLLQAGFHQMVAGPRERERSRDLFGRQVGEDVVRHALEHGVALGGEAREAAVLFVGLQGATALAEDRDPAEVVAVLNAFFAVVVDVVAAHDGWVNKFEGDAALCVFGAPLTNQDAASRALAAGRSLRARLASELDVISAGIGVCRPGRRRQHRRGEAVRVHGDRRPRKPGRAFDGARPGQAGAAARLPSRAGAGGPRRGRTMADRRRAHPPRAVTDHHRGRHRVPSCTSACALRVLGGVQAAENLRATRREDWCNCAHRRPPPLAAAFS